MNPPCRTPRHLHALCDNPVLFFLIFAALLNLLGCGTPQGSTGLVLRAQPANLDFGTVSPGSKTVTRALKLTNMGAFPIRLQALSLVPSSAFTVQGWSGPVTLLSGQDYQVLVAFSPNLASNYSGTILLSAAYAGDMTSGAHWGETLHASGRSLQWTQTVALHAKASSNNTVSLSVRPNSVNLHSGQGYQFSAVVTGENKSVNWIANLGTITAGGWYTAPAVSQNTQDTVIATSAANPYSYAVALVSVSPVSIGNSSSIAVSLSPNSASVQPGHSLQFTSQVTGTSNTGVTWTAALGSISPSGLYTAPSLAPTVDTISAVSVADPSKYAKASVAVQSAQIPNAGTWTVANQQPVTQQYYPNSLVTTPLPSNVMSHLASNSSTIINNVFYYDASQNYAVLYELPSQGSASAQMAFYYSTASDPIYKVLSCANVPSDSRYNPVNKYFHLSNQAMPTINQSGSDSFMLLWDQSTDIDSTPGGRILSLYNPHVSLPNCNCTTTACADTNTSCQISGSSGNGYGHYCEIGFPNDQVVYGMDKSSGGYGSIHFQAAAGFLRDNEIIGGTVNHALLLNTYCVTSGVVFPGTGYGANNCTNSSPPPADGDFNNHPHVGSLIFIDSSYNCDALPQWQRGVCHAMQTYGGYITDTGGYSTAGGFGTVRVESGVSYALAGVSWPFLAYIQTQSGNGLTLRGSPVNGANMPFFNMPGVQSHLHVADPCVAETMAGMTVNQGACP
jgi:hypothetical protein